MNRQTPSVPLVRTVTLSMALALSSCSEPSKPPPPPSAAPAFKDARSEPPAAAAPQASPTPPPAPSEPPAAAAPQARPTSPTPAPQAAQTPEQLFFRMGCKACHGPGSAYGSLLVRARNRPAEEIAKWILHPEQIRPGTLMPSYAKRLSQEQALALANWIKAGNPAPSQ